MNKHPFKITDAGKEYKWSQFEMLEKQRKSKEAKRNAKQFLHLSLRGNNY